MIPLSFWLTLSCFQLHQASIAATIHQVDLVSQLTAKYDSETESELLVLISMRDDIATAKDMKCHSSKPHE